MVSVMVQPAGFRCQARSFAVGAAWLAVGVFIYAVARPPTALGFPPQAPFLQALLPASILALLGPAPTFLHAYAFSMMTASIVGGSRGRLLLVCGAWASLEIVFELAQSPALGHWLLQRPASALPVPYLQAHLAGTFDLADILAGLLGAALAARSLTPQRR